MGAYTFITGEIAGQDLTTAFDQAVEQARWEHGHGGYTGTIAEKDSVSLVSDSPMTVDEAREFARRYLDDTSTDDCADASVHDKWGPAGAIRTHGGWVFFGWASS